MEEGSNHMEGEKGMNQSQGGEEEKEPISWRGSREGTNHMQGGKRRNQPYCMRVIYTSHWPQCGMLGSSFTKGSKN